MSQAPRLLRNPSTFRRSTGPTPVAFHRLLAEVTPAGRAARTRRGNRVGRQRKAGAGREATPTPADPLLMLSTYYRAYLPHAFLGLLSGPDDGNVGRSNRRLEPPLAGVFRIPERKAESSREEMREDAPQREYALRDALDAQRYVVDAIPYQHRSGCQWDMLPRDLPPRSTVHDYYARWRDDGTWQRAVDALRAKVRVAAGREPTPSVGAIDSRAVKGTEAGGPEGYDGGKRGTGRKRHIVADTLGLLLAVAVTAAGTAATAGTTSGSWRRARPASGSVRYISCSGDSIQIPGGSGRRSATPAKPRQNFPDSLSHLAGCPDLCALNLGGAKIDGSGRAHLRGVMKLTRLSLECTGITGTGLVQRPYGTVGRVTIRSERGGVWRAAGRGLTVGQEADPCTVSYPDFARKNLPAVRGNINCYRTRT